MAFLRTCALYALSKQKYTINVIVKVSEAPFNVLCIDFWVGIDANGSSEGPGLDTLVLMT